MIRRVRAISAACFDVVAVPELESTDLALRGVRGVAGLPGTFGGIEFSESRADRLSAVSGRIAEDDWEVGGAVRLDGRSALGGG